MPDSCPRCGYVLKQPLWRAAYGWHQRQLATMNSSTVLPWAAAPSAANGPRFAEAERRQPLRAQNLESDFLTPLSQAVATTVFVSACGLYAAYKLENFTWDYGLAVGLAAGGIYWLTAMAVNRRLLWLVEKITNSDIDGDQQIGQPPADIPPMEVIHKKEDGRINSMYRLKLPETITAAKLGEFARGAALKGLTHGAWTGGGNSFSRAEFDTLMSELERAGIVVWTDPANHAQGRRLTHAGRSALTHWASQLKN